MARRCSFGGTPTIAWSRPRWRPRAPSGSCRASGASPTARARGGSTSTTSPAAGGTAPAACCARLRSAAARYLGLPGLALQRPGCAAHSARAAEPRIAQREGAA
eukprot:scaffold42738_cov65-Phaeocystis_antarctica.AAC.7